MSDSSEEAMSFGLAKKIPRGGALEWLARGAAATFRQGDIADGERYGKLERPTSSYSYRKPTVARAYTDYRNLGIRLEAILKSHTIQQTKG